MMATINNALYLRRIIKIFFNNYLLILLILISTMSHDQILQDKCVSDLQRVMYMQQ